ncbi:RagB/SusD family nutrient uptake outer membrane protein [Alistipes sp. OttesenSCG-928-B03]|nr:RagB/SusD family nutrient uptake outer membrane protein [Alistipes sp. OttesenSCG-928-B03]
MKNRYEINAKVRRFFTVAASALAVAGMGACDDFLDVPPTSDVSIPSTLEEYKEMLYGLNQAWLPDPLLAVMGDDIYWSEFAYKTYPSGNDMREGYKWQDELYDVTELPASWEKFYALIYTLNKVVDEVPPLEGVAEGAKQELIAEARMYRAMNYFQLVSAYAKPYHMATADTPGIPVTRHNDVSETAWKRTPVHEVYQYILDDLDDATTYLPIHTSTQSRYRGNRIGAHGLKARVLFNMTRYEDAKKELITMFKLIEDNPNPALTYKLYDYVMLNDYFSSMVGIFWLIPSMDTEAIFSVTYMSDPGNGYSHSGSNSVYIAPWVVDLADPDDLRVALEMHETQDDGITPADPQEDGCIILRGVYSNMGITMPDAYLMLAECHARAGELTEALRWLNDLRKTRFAYDNEDTAVRESNNKDQIIKWILEERIVEFAGTGYRWFDMRRLWNDPIGSQMIHKTHKLGSQTFTLTEDRITLRIPGYVMQYHTDWEQNM